MIGTCGLCLQTAELIDSHLMPKAIYRVMRKTKPDEDSRIFLTQGKNLVSTDKQYKRHFLCCFCEDLLSKNGERHVINDCYRGETFLLKDKIIKLPIMQDKFNITVYDSTASVNLEDIYIYFSLSIFWRASAASWIDYKAYKNALGDQYQENIRKYLLAPSKELLKNICIIVEVDFSDPPLSALELPRHKRKEMQFFHTFRIPGMNFLMFIEKSNKNPIISGPNNIFFTGYNFFESPEALSLKRYLSSLKRKVK